MPPRKRTKPEAAVRFWEQVDIKGKDECWLFTGSCNQVNGYGNKHWNGRVFNAHVVAYMIHHNFDSLPPKFNGSRTNIMHTCDVRLCCNPKHLVLGSTKLNQRDKVNKRRHHNQTRSTCAHGHAWTEENTKYFNYPSHRAKDGTPWNVRYCRECLRIRAEKRKKRGNS